MENYGNSGPFYGTAAMGSLQSALNRVIDRDTRCKTPGGVWVALRGTCGYTDDELVTHAVMLGMEIERPQDRTGFWGASGSNLQCTSAGLLAWRWLMDNHRFVLEKEYNDRNR